ncbi:MAG: VWA domain-containing protein [Polyangiaceae bacterium]|jgi:Ca-activated chloride channel family protein|nr:VWA domain-containing protein [Polyangiaceae bacterium]
MKTRSLLLELRTSPLRQGLALGSILAALGAAVLLHAPAGPPRALAAPHAPLASHPAPLAPTQAATLSGEGVQGTLTLSHGALLAGSPRRLFAELKLKADQAPVKQRAPLSLVVALDTSGSMEGDKIRQARAAVERLIRDMQQDDEIALVTYSDHATIRQPLAPVGAVRNALLAQVRSLSAGGGTSIPDALDASLQALQEAREGRVRRVVLVSDGIDSGRSRAEQIASLASSGGIALSSLGVGLDFNESYMASLARTGRGNFAFVKEGSELSAFLRRELDESASTRVENASVRLRLPHGFSLGKVAGIASVHRDGPLVELQLGHLFSGEERRIILELQGEVKNDPASLEGDFSWKSRETGLTTRASWGPLAVAPAVDLQQEQGSAQGAVLASAISALASLRQLEATEAYARGEQQRAQALIDNNVVDLEQARALAPVQLQGSLENQAMDYRSTRKHFEASPGSEDGKVAAKKSYHKDVLNLRSSSY